MGANGRLKLNGIFHVLLSLPPLAVLNSMTPNRIGCSMDRRDVSHIDECGAIYYLRSEADMFKNPGCTNDG
jgi:hypothetical protein